MEKGGTEVRVERIDDGLAIHITGERARDFDPELLQQCASAIMGCADRSECLGREGLRINEQCVDTLARHNHDVGCASRAFGFAPAGAATAS